MKKILIVLTVIMLTACSNEQQQAQRPSKSTATEKKEIPPTKVLVVDQSCKKIEVSLYKGNNIVVFEGSSVEKLKDKRALDRVTVYRIWKENDPTDWKIDMASPQFMDTIQIFLDGTSLRKLEYRQGYIYSIYK